VLIALIIVSTFAALSSSIQPTQAAPTLVSGINYMSNGNAWTEPDSTLNADFARFRSDGITHVSIRIMWSVMMPSSSGLSTTAMNNLKRVLNAAEANGLKVNLDFWTQFGYTLGFPTSWAGNDYYSLLSNPTKSYYLSYMRNVVTQLRSHPAIESWSILNEPYYSSSSQKAAFQTLMADCVNAIKSVDSSRPVICRFTLSYTPGSGKYDDSVYDLFDAFAVTLYLDPSNPSDTRYNGRWSYWENTVAACKARNIPLWVIEFGDDNTNTEHVRQHYQQSLAKFAAAGVVRAYAWAWQTRSASNEAFNIYSGSAPEPAYYELAKYPSTPSTTNPTPTATSTQTLRPTNTPQPTQTPVPTTTPRPPSTSLSYPANGQIEYGRTNSAYMPWTRKEACVPAFINLVNRYGGTYESIGKSSSPNNWDIIMFKFGNPNGAPIMIDAQLHGNEFYGYEVLYALANWLLSSGDADARRILQNNYVLMVPVVDYRWGRTNYNSPSWMTTNDPSQDGGRCGVNLNRNFNPGWSSSLSNSNTDSYSGVAPNSEKESQALINAWNKYHPRIYWNLHQGSSPMTSCSATSTQARNDANRVLSLLPSIRSSQGVTNGWSFSVGSGGSGYAKDGAAATGAAGFLTELMSGWDNSASKRADLTSGATIRQAKTILKAMCRAIEGTTTPPPPTSTPAQTLAPTRTPLATPAVSQTGIGTQFTTNGNGVYEYKYSTVSISPAANSVQVKGNFRVAQCGMVQSGDRIKLIELRAGSTIVAAAGLWQKDTAMYWWIETRNGANWVETVTSRVNLDTAQWFNLELRWSNGATNGAGALLVNGEQIYSINNADTDNFGSATQARIGIAEAYNCATTTVYTDAVTIAR